MSPLRVVPDDLSRPEVVALLGEHLASMRAQSPPGSVHALDLDRLRTPALSLWTAWEGDVLAGCGALQPLDPTHGEVKSMRTAGTHLRRGVAAALLTRILEEAVDRGYARLSLETGSGSGFEAARGLYERFGFEPCGPFGDYVEDPFSRYLTRVLPG